MAKFAEGLEVPAGPAAEIQDRERRLALDGCEQCLDVLADIVIACALPERFRVLVIMFEGGARDVLEIERVQCHVRGASFIRFGRQFSTEGQRRISVSGSAP